MSEIKYEIDLTKIQKSADGNSLSILRRPYVEVDGQKAFLGNTQRSVFSLFDVDVDEDGNKTTKENPNFKAQIDEFTGVKDFIDTVFNF